MPNLMVWPCSFLFCHLSLEKEDKKGLPFANLENQVTPGPSDQACCSRCSDRTGPSSVGMIQPLRLADFVSFLDLSQAPSSLGGLRDRIRKSGREKASRERVSH